MLEKVAGYFHPGKYAGLKENLREKLKEKYAMLALNRALTQIATLVASFLCGAMAARGIVFGRYAPFGVAVVAAVPRSGIWAAFLGASISYLLPAPVYIPARYIAAAAACVAIRWTMSDWKALQKRPWFAPVCSFLPLLGTGLALSTVGDVLRTTIILYIAEAFLGAGSAFFFARTYMLCSGFLPANAMDHQDMACISISLGVLLLSFRTAVIGEVSLGHILQLLFILLAARYGGTAGGAIAGVTAGMLQGLSTAGITYISGAYGLVGTMAGVFSVWGRVCSALAAVAAHTLASLQVGSSVSVISGIYEIVLAAGISIFLPNSLWCSTLFGAKKDSISCDALRQNMRMRLRYSADALRSVSDSVDAVSEKLSAVTAPTIEDVYADAVSNTCSGCGLWAYCHEKNAEQTLHYLTMLTPVLRRNGHMEKTDFSPDFSRYCGRTEELKERINAGFDDFLSRESAELRAEQVKTVVEGQFTTTAAVLSDLSAEFDLCERFDEETAERVGEVFRRAGVMPIEVSCRVDKYGRMTIDAETTRTYHLKMNRAQLRQELNRACSRHFMQPCVSVTHSKCRFSACEHPQYRVICGMAQHVSSGSALCGDSITQFYDGCGRFIALISDGMGTGGRAAIDGAMASGMAETLLKAGMGVESTLQIINTALMAKSGDESLSTLDMAFVDLFTGQVEIKKAGAPASFVCRRHKVSAMQTSSLPIGILQEVEYASASTTLEDGDFLVLVSDGVIAAGTEWLYDLLAHYEGEDPDALSRRVVERALQERTDGHEDDVTAVTVFLRKERGYL